MNKTDYDKRMTQILGSLGEIRPNLLLHCCCAPCAAYPLTQLTPYFNVTVYFYNPNIRPRAEYEKRRSELIKLAARFESVRFLEGGCGGFDEIIEGRESQREGGERCRDCIALRINQTAQTAANGGFDYFATTLTVSPHKDAEFINMTGEAAQNTDKSRYLPSDFKKRGGFIKGAELCREWDIYRQNYCGCSPRSGEERTVDPD